MYFKVYNIVIAFLLYTINIVRKKWEDLVFRFVWS